VWVLVPIAKFKGLCKLYLFSYLIMKVTLSKVTSRGK
jgi:hypothetical protein